MTQRHDTKGLFIVAIMQSLSVTSYGPIKKVYFLRHKRRKTCPIQGDLKAERSSYLVRLTRLIPAG